MSPALLVAAAVGAAMPAAGQVQSTPKLVQAAEQAIAAGRFYQARVMIARAASAGASEEELNRALAQLAFSTGNLPEAMVRYQHLLASSPSDTQALEALGIAALKLRQIELAHSTLSRATATPGATWRAWNARGVAADLMRNWAEADRCYDEALRLAPREPIIANNLGWSFVLRGEWRRALELLERASLMHFDSPRASNNLELAQSAVRAELPKRRVDESDTSWAARLNDAGVAAAILGDRTRATAAFSQALEARATWYARAANNLEAFGRQ